MKKLKHVFIILFFVLILLSLGGAYAYFFTDIFKDPMEQFLKYAQTIEIIDLVNEDFINEFEKKLKSSSSEFNIEISANLPVEDNGNTDYSKFNIDILAKNDVFLNKSSANVNLNYGDNRLLNVVGLADMNNIAAYSQEVDSKYVGVGKDNYGKIIERATDGEYTEVQYNQIINTLTNTDVSDLTKEQREAMKNDFTEIVKQYFFTDKFVVEKNISTMYKENPVNVNAYSVNLTKEDAYNILIKEIDTLKNDATFLNFVVENYNASNPETTLTATSLTELLNSWCLAFQNQKAQEQDLAAKALRVTLYVENEKVIKVDIVYNSDVEISLEMYSDGIKFTTIANAAPLVELATPEGSQAEVTADRIGFSIEVAKSTPSEIAETYKYDISLIQNNKIMYKVIFENTRTGVITTNNIENVFNITFKNMPKNEETKLYITAKTEFKDDIQIDDINPENTVFLDKLSDEEFGTYLNDLKEKIFKVYSDKVKEFGIISSKSSSTIIEQPGMEVQQPAQEEQTQQPEQQQPEQNTQQQQNPTTEQPNVSATQLTKEQVQQMIVNAIVAKSQEIVNNENRNITLNDLQNLTIDGEAVSALITNETATLSYKGFSFTIDSSFNIT